MRIVRIDTALACVAVLAVASPIAGASAEAAPAAGCVTAGYVAHAADSSIAAQVPFPPLQLAVEVPVEPTPFRSGGYRYLVYELHLRNHSDEAMPLGGLVVSAAGARDGAIATLSATELRERIRPIGPGSDIEGVLPGGKAAAVLLCLAFSVPDAVPAALAHRVRIGDALAVGPPVGTRQVEPKVLAPPVAGPDWLADNGPGLASHHRGGLFVVDGQARISRRFAIDWKRAVDGATHAGDAADVTSYFAYGEPVYAVADATVVDAVDGLPDNVPRTADGFTPAVALTMENVAGNRVVLDLGDGQYAYYAHLRPGSVRVAAGDRVRRGDPLAQIGNSGDARWPHLHFQVATGPHILAAEGVPFLIDAYDVRDEDGTWRPRIREYPIGDVIVRFAAAGDAAGDESSAPD